MQQTIKHIARHFLSVRQQACSRAAAVCFVIISIFTISCEREPMLHLHKGGTDILVELPDIDLELQLLWDYLFSYDVEYDWQKEWLYGWDETDNELFGPLGYPEPTDFNIRRYFTNDVQFGQHTAPYKHYITGKTLSAQYDFGFWDILAWNEIHTSDGVQSVRIDETATYDYVTAYTGQTMMAARYNAPQYTRAFYQPEALFAGYESGIGINKNFDGFTFDEDRKIWVRKLNMTLQPVTYIYLPQIILHNNNRDHRIVTAIDGNANLSGMSRSVNLNTGVTGPDAITVNFNMRMKFDRNGRSNDKVDIIGGKVLTFGIINLNPHKLNTRAYAESMQKVMAADKNNRHYLDVKMQFYNGKDSTLVFDVTNQVRRLFRGGVITVELDMDTVPIPQRSGGSGFDAVVKDYEEKQWEFDM